MNSYLLQVKLFVSKINFPSFFYNCSLLERRNKRCESEISKHVFGHLSVIRNAIWEA